MTQHAPRPSDVRARILAEHELLRALYVEIETAVALAAAGDRAAEDVLRDRCRVLYQTLLRHIAVEDAFLAPALRETAGFGPLRADELLQEHAQQRKLLRYLLSSLDELTSATALIQSIPSLLQSLRTDMAHEERALLDPELLKDDLIDGDMNTG